MNRNFWRGLIPILVMILALAAGWLVARERMAPAPIVAPSSVTPMLSIPITVRAVTNTPIVIDPATVTPQPPTATYPVPLEMLTQTNTPNPSTLVTPSPAVLPETGAIGEGAGPASLLIGVGLILASIGIVVWRSRKHPSW